MKYYAPQIAWHDRKSLYSIDVQNGCVTAKKSLDKKNQSTKSAIYRIATGGTDARVNIWHISILDIPDLDKKKPVDSIECVAELTQHQRSVNVVRFSPNPSHNYLATADDDALIYIWKLCEDEEGEKPSSETPFGESEVISVESWKIFKTLRGHTRDVCDLNWSKSGDFIVSGGVDNQVLVWDVQKGSRLHKLAKEHSSYVLGVAYDPLNRYVASISNDRCMLVFNSKTGKTVQRVDRILTTGSSTTAALTESTTKSEQQQQQQEDGDNSTVTTKKFLKLFHDQSMMSFCRRLSFTPGGEFLIVPSGIVEKDNADGDVQNVQNVLYVFERKSLNQPSFTLPTQKFSLAVRCCPVLFQLKKDNPSNIFNLPYRIVFAAATEDAVHFYDSQQTTPFAYISQIHYLRLTDISWSNDGRFLMVTSSDGFTSFVVFDHGELGVPYTGEMLTLEQLEPTPIVTPKPKKVKEAKPLAASTKEEKENNKKAEKKKIIKEQTSGNSEITPNKKKKTEKGGGSTNGTPSTATKKQLETPKSQNIAKFFNKVSTTPNGTTTSIASSSPNEATPKSASTAPNGQFKAAPSPQVSPHENGDKVHPLPTKKTEIKSNNNTKDTKAARRVSLITLFSNTANSRPASKTQQQKQDLSKVENSAKISNSDPAGDSSDCVFIEELSTSAKNGRN